MSTSPRNSGTSPMSLRNETSLQNGNSSHNRTSQLNGSQIVNGSTMGSGTSSGNLVNVSSQSENRRDSGMEIHRMSSYFRTKGHPTFPGMDLFTEDNSLFMENGHFVENEDDAIDGNGIQGQPAGHKLQDSTVSSAMNGSRHSYGMNSSSQSTPTNNSRQSNGMDASKRSSSMNQSQQSSRTTQDPSVEKLRHCSEWTTDGNISINSHMLSSTQGTSVFPDQTTNVRTQQEQQQYNVPPVVVTKPSVTDSVSDASHISLGRMSDPETSPPTFSITHSNLKDTILSNTMSASFVQGRYTLSPGINQSMFNTTLPAADQTVQDINLSLMKDQERKLCIKNSLNNLTKAVAK